MQWHQDRACIGSPCLKMRVCGAFCIRLVETRQSCVCQPLCSTAVVPQSQIAIVCSTARRIPLRGPAQHGGAGTLLLCRTPVRYPCNLQCSTASLASQQAGTVTLLPHVLGNVVAIPSLLNTPSDNRSALPSAGQLLHCARSTSRTRTACWRRRWARTLPRSCLASRCWQADRTAPSPAPSPARWEL